MTRQCTKWALENSYVPTKVIMHLDQMNMTFCGCKKANRFYAESHVETRRMSRAERSDWRDIIQIGETFDAKTSANIVLLAEYSSIWDEHVGVMARAEFKIEIEISVEPFRSIPHQASIKMCGIKNDNIKKI